MYQVFNVVPIGFFNNLASGSNQRIYADCIQLIYKEYEREISYRIPRNRISDSLAIYFLENHVELSNEEYSGDKTANDMAGAVLRKFLSKEIGWLDEEIDDATYEKQIIMTENGIALAEFLNQLEKPEQEEFSSYIYNIYNTLSLAQTIVVFMTDLRFALEKYGLKEPLDKTTMANILSLFSKYNLRWNGGRDS